MATYRVFDQDSARLLSTRVSHADRIEQVRDGEYFAANPGDVILAPSIKDGEVLYIRIKNPANTFAPRDIRDTHKPVAAAVETQTATPDQPSASVPQELGETPRPTSIVGVETKPAHDDQPKPKSYVATGFLGLDGELEEEIPEAPKPWWKRMFVD